MVHQCPRCELRFPTEAEVTEHLGHDHGAEVAHFERYRYPAGRDALPPLYDDPPPAGSARRVLVVANQTLGGGALTERIRSLAEETPTRFHVVVPATHSTDYPGAARRSTGTSPKVTAVSDEQGIAQARWRLRHALELFRALGEDVTGEVGPPDPLEAVAHVLEREQFDAVLVSTLPSGVSRWLGIDLPQRIGRRWKLPVSTVVVSQSVHGPVTTTQ